jgi:hypothetical protein
VSLLKGDALQKGQDVDFYVADFSLLIGTIFPLDYDEEGMDVDRGNYPDWVPVHTILVGDAVKLQFMHHPSSKAICRRVERFDIPICRNMYSLAAGLRICHPKELTHSCCKVNITAWMEECDNSPSCHQPIFSLKPLYTRLKERVEKYVQRGFDIGYEAYMDVIDFKTKYICPMEKVPFIRDTLEIYALMGRFPPAYDTQGEAVFYWELKEKWAQRQVNRLWEEYQIEWKVFFNQMGCKSHRTELRNVKVALLA